MKSNKHQTQDVAESLSYYPTIPNQVIEDNFKKKMQSSNSGAYLEMFLAVAKRITENARSFCFQDFVINTRAYEFPIPKLKEIFEAWVEYLVQLNKLTILQSVYDYEIYVVN